MLKKLTVRDFKSLSEVTVELPRLSVLFGPNAVGKSNLLDAIQALSWMGNARTVIRRTRGAVSSKWALVRVVLLRSRRAS